MYFDLYGNSTINSMHLNSCCDSCIDVSSCFRTSKINMTIRTIQEIEFLTHVSLHFNVFHYNLFEIIL